MLVDNSALEEIASIWNRLPNLAVLPFNRLKSHLKNQNYSDEAWADYASMQLAIRVL
jgi:hypothetical protein